MVLGYFNKTEGSPAQGADFREAMKNADKTQPPAGLLASIVKHLPIDTAAKSAARANDRVTSAEGDLIKAEIALEQLRKENAEREAKQVEYVEKRKRALDVAIQERERLHCHFLNEAKAMGALEGCPYVDWRSMPATEKQTTTEDGK